MPGTVPDTGHKIIYNTQKFPDLRNLYSTEENILLKKMTDYSMGIIILGEKKIQTCLIENKSWQDCGNNYIGYAKESLSGEKAFFS